VRGGQAVAGAPSPLRTAGGTDAVQILNRTFKNGEIEMSFRGPILIKEPELRWPIVLLAALMTAAIALLVVVMYFVASTVTN